MKVVVLGAAVSGSAAARLARRAGYQTVVYDRNSSALPILRGEGFEVHSGAWSERPLEGADLVITSPGFAEHSEPIRSVLASGISLISELEFGVRFLDAPYVAVTGTNGKTTATTAAAAMLDAAGLKSVAAGNVGTAVCDVAGEPWDIVVVEASSFQLRFVADFHPRAAAVLNVAPDHLDWHGSFEAYAAAKARIFENMGPGEVLAYDADDPGAAAVVSRSTAEVTALHGSPLRASGGDTSSDPIRVAGHEFAVPTDDPSYRLDLSAAATLALTVGGTSEGVRSALLAFRPGPHRRSLVGTWDEVSWVDDSKATNPHAAAAAAAAYRSVVLIAGGRNKGLDLQPMLDVPGVHTVVALGEAAAEIAAAAPDRTEVAGDLATAVPMAEAAAAAGDTVLLAPGCASFDQFASYAERGDRFSELVRERKEMRS